MALRPIAAHGQPLVMLPLFGVRHAEEECEASTARLAEMQEELRQSRLERQHKEEYEHVARLINQMPSREDIEGCVIQTFAINSCILCGEISLHSQIGLRVWSIRSQKAELEAAVAKLEEEYTTVHQDISRRQQQFRALWRSLRDLELLLEGEESQASVAPAQEEETEGEEDRTATAGAGSGRVAVEMDDQ